MLLMALESCIPNHVFAARLKLVVQTSIPGMVAEARVLIWEFPQITVPKTLVYDGTRIAIGTNVCGHEI